MVVLDTADSDTSNGGAMATWLTLDLAANLRAWTVVVTHSDGFEDGDIGCWSAATS